MRESIDASDKLTLARTLRKLMKYCSKKDLTPPYTHTRTTALATGIDPN